MAIIPQKQLFKWWEIDELGDLQRLLLVLNYLPDAELMKKLEQERGRGRNDYPVRAVWNSILAGVVCQHPSIKNLRREPSSPPGPLQLQMGHYIQEAHCGGKGKQPS